MARVGGVALTTDTKKTAAFVEWARRNSFLLAVVGYAQLKRGIQLDK